MNKRPDLLDLPNRSTNILELNDPDQYDGKLWRYQHSHSVLVLMFHKRSDNPSNEKWEPLFVGVEPVLYLDMPVVWRGANIQLGSNHECIELREQHGWHDTPAVHEEGMRPLGYRLITIPHPFGIVKIVSTQLYIIENDMV